MAPRQKIYPTFRYRDAARMLRWLTEVVGFAEVNTHREGETVAHAELALGGSIMMLGQVHDDAYGSEVGEPGPALNGGKSLYLAVGNPDDLFKRVEASGVEILEGLTDRDYGSREFRCRDFEGNIWCFGTYAPQVGG